MICPKCNITELIPKWDGFECTACEYWWHESTTLKEFVRVEEEVSK